MVSKSFALFLFVAACLATLPGCMLVPHAWRFGSFELPPEIPIDFVFSMEHQGAGPGGLNYLYKFARNGTVDYRVQKAGAPGVPVSGSYSVSGDEMIDFYGELRSAAFSAQESRDRGEQLQDSNVKVDGQLILFAFSEGREKRVTYEKCFLPEQTKRVYDAAFALIPGEYRRPDPGKHGPTGAAERFVGDRRSMLFYPSDAEAVKDIPAEERAFFSNPYEALDHGFYPDKETNPMERVDPK